MKNPLDSSSGRWHGVAVTEGLLQTCRFDYNFKFAQTLTIPLSLLHKGAMKHAIHEADNLNSSALFGSANASPVHEKMHAFFL